MNLAALLRCSALCLFLIGLFGAMPTAALAQTSFNIDFGTFYGVPSPVANGASGQSGFWNEADLGTTALIDVTGGATSASVTVNATLTGSSGGGDEMIRDNFYVTAGNLWAVDISGIENGAYVVYVYAPTNSSVSSGDFFVYGEAITSIPGDDSGALIEGVSYIKSFAQVTTGGISLLGSGPSFTGLAGVQLVRIPAAGFNIDFGVFYGVPSSAATGAVPQSGIWNEASLGTTALVDRVGNETGVSVVVTADANGSSGGGDEMIRDNFYSTSGNQWSVDLVGLGDGPYVAYAYAPTNTSVSSGDVDVEGTLFASIPGTNDGALIEGVSFFRAFVEVVGGSLSLSGSGLGNTGLAGLQLVHLVPGGFNIDFGVFYGVPSPAAKGASHQSGYWNEAGLGMTGLVDAAGYPTGVSVTVAAAANGSSGGGDEMIRDNFYQTGGSAWFVDLVGIPNGGYLAYVYAPTNSGVSSGDFQVELEPFTSIPGDPTGAFVEGVSFVRTFVEVTSGTVSLSGDGASFTGLAGMQLIPIPEPSFLPMIASGVGCLWILGRRRRRRRQR